MLVIIPNCHYALAIPKSKEKHCVWRRYIGTCLFLTGQKMIIKKSKNHKNFTNFYKIRNLTKKFHPDGVYNDTYGPTVSNLKIRSMV